MAVAAEQQELNPKGAVPPGGASAAEEPKEFAQLVSQIIVASSAKARKTELDRGYKALRKVQQWTASSHACREALRKRNAFRSLTRLLHSKDDRMASIAARILQNAAGFNPSNRRELADSGVIPHLLEVTGAGDSVASAAVGALSNIFHSDQKNKLLGVDEDAAAVLCKLVQTGSPTVVEMCARALSNFVVGCVPAARAAVAAGAIPALLQSVKYLKQNVTLVSLSMRALSNLAAISQTFRDQLRDDGVPSAASSLLSWCVADELRAGNKQVQVLAETVCACIANLARDAPAHRRAIERAVPMLCTLLPRHTTAKATTEQGVRALWCLLVDTPKNRLLAADSGVFGVLVALLSQPSRLDSNSKAFICNAARHAVVDFQAGQAAALRSGLVKSITKCIGGTTPPALWRAALAALLDMGAGYPAAWRAMREHGLNTLWLPASEMFDDEPPVDSGEMASSGPPGLDAAALEASQALVPLAGGCSASLEDSLDFSASLASMQDSMGLTSIEPTQPYTAMVDGAAGMQRLTRVPAPHLRPGLHFGNVKPDAVAQPVAETAHEDFHKPLQRQLPASTEAKWPELERVARNDAPFHPAATPATRKLVEQAGMSFYSPHASAMSEQAGAEGAAGALQPSDELLDGDSIVLRGSMAMLGVSNDLEGKTDTSTWLGSSAVAPHKQDPASIFRHETSGPTAFPPPEADAEALQQTAMRRTFKAPHAPSSNATSIPASSIGTAASPLVSGGASAVDARWGRSIDKYRVPGAGSNAVSPVRKRSTQDLSVASVFAPGEVVDLDALLDEPAPPGRVDTGLRTASVDASVLDSFGGTVAVGRQGDMRRQDEAYAMLHPTGDRLEAIGAAYKHGGRLQTHDPSAAMQWTASRHASRQRAEEAARIVRAGSAHSLGYQPHASTGSSIRDELDLFFALASDDGVRQRELRQRGAVQQRLDEGQPALGHAIRG